MSDVPDEIAICTVATDGRHEPGHPLMTVYDPTGRRVGSVRYCERCGSLFQRPLSDRQEKRKRRRK